MNMLGKAARPDEVPVEAWKVLGNCGVNRLRKPVEVSRGLRAAAGRLEAEGDGCHLPGAVELNACEIHRRRDLYRSLGDREKRRSCYLVFLDFKEWCPGTSGNGNKGHVRTLESGSTNSTRDDKEDGYHSVGASRTILYADDIALVADSREELEEKVQLRQGALAGNGLRVNVRKTKFISSEQCTEPILDCQGTTPMELEKGCGSEATSATFINTQIVCGLPLCFRELFTVSGYDSTEIPCVVCGYK
ncbi:unnamed protein product [Heligmosomoides polygyrus]|uniref:Reverse transcriptase domain-containing protein n=1 Tax=Heligmosomoides polygyrus TaxID=6339 RepID=A0A183GCZ3_HELPZ|nr:unnamed protein product [Heligmosomoides polygyrus]